MDTPLPRPEYPRPQFIRQQWLCLNGAWQFEIDPGDSGLERGLLERPLARQILLPFCPESPLSGIGHTDHLGAVWYRRELRIPPEWADARVLLHFQAIDYDATIWVNGRELRRHRGGFTPITCDLTGVAAPGDPVTIVVRARDDHRALKPKGKQSHLYRNMGCHYTRTTGIWQTVWMEPVHPGSALLRPRITPDVANGCFLLEQPIDRPAAGLRLRATLSDDQGVLLTREVPADHDFSPRLILPVPQPRRRLWSPADPFLYDLRLELLDAAGAVIDQAASYAGLRGVTLDGNAIRINGDVVFQRLVLDQGYYPDGILTAPSDAALARDIELAQAAGFNGARLHQKVFEERFLYHADRLGYLVWGEFPDWGCHDGQRHEENQRPDAAYITQWLEVLARDYSHPAIIGWCPLNETAEPIIDKLTALDDVTRGMFLAAKAMDQTRPVLDASGYSHRVPEADVYDSHDYTQDPAEFAERHAHTAAGRPFVNEPGGRPASIPWRGQPCFVSEFGGIWWNPDATPGEHSWGYGDAPRTIGEFYARFRGLCEALLRNPALFGYCYTQLTDVYQEQNGIYTFDRRCKFDLDRIRAIQQLPAAIEQAHRPTRPDDSSS